MILAAFPEGSSLTAPGRDCKLPLLCLERQSSLHLPDMWMTLTEAEEMVRLCFFFLWRWRGLKSYLHLSEAGGHVVWARVWAFSHVDGLFARFRAPEICLGDKLRGGTTADRAFKALQLDWRASVCLPTAWLLNSAFQLLTICPESSRGWALQLPVNTWYWHKYCCSTKSVNGGLQEV